VAARSALVVEVDIFLKDLVGFDAGERCLGVQGACLVVFVLAGQNQDLLHPVQVLIPGGLGFVVEGALLGRVDQGLVALVSLFDVVDPLLQQDFLRLLAGFGVSQQMGANDGPVGDGSRPDFAEYAHARQPTAGDLNG
jgi:hypothetical protein